MIRIIRMEGVGETPRQVTLKIDSDRDSEVWDKIENLILDQSMCENCVNYYKDGYFCGYCAHLCKKGHNLEAANSKYYDIDGRDCEDYERKSKSAN